MNNTHTGGPPRIAIWLMERFCSYDFLITALGDMDELYELNRDTKGPLKADLAYFRDAMGVIYHLYFKGNSQYSTNTTVMIKNNIILALRNLKRNRLYSGLNLAGLASGLLIFLMIITYVRYEFSYDDYHENKENIYRVYKSFNYLDIDYWDAGTPGPLAPAMVEELPDVIAAARTIRWRNQLFTVNDKTFLEHFFPVDPDIFKVFSFQAVDGNLSSFVNEPDEIALSKSAALKFFGRTDVTGELVKYSEEVSFKVSGVFEDMPLNSQVRFDIVGNFEGLQKKYGQGLTNWNNNPYFTYIRTAPGVVQDELEAKMPELRAKFADDPIDEDGQSVIYHLQTLQDSHFTSKIDGGLGADTVDKSRLYTFLAIALAVLLMSCINYVNLATARSISRLKEVGARKIVGAQKGHLLMQFLIEAGLLIGLAFVLALITFYLLLPSFAAFVELPLSLEFSVFNNWVMFVGLWLVLTLTAGIYPALIASSYHPLTMLSGRLSSGKTGTWLRNSLVVFQLMLSAGLAIGAITVGRQLHYIDTADTGYTREKVLLLSTRDDQIDDNLKSYMDQLSNISGVAEVATSWSLPTNVTSNAEADWPGIKDNERISMYMMGVTHDFFDLYQIELAEGRLFDPEIRTDRRAIILNETAVKTFGWSDPVGREMISQGKKGTVIGVVKDFHIKSLREEIEPLQIILNGNYARLAVRVSGDIATTIDEIEKVYESFSPNYPFEVRYFEDVYDNAYANDRNMASLTTAFTILAVIIACLGIYGMASYQVHNQIKALGIRKVMGASSWRIARMLFGKFTVLLLLAMILVSPLAYWIMQGWLEGFAYHVSFGVDVFALTFVLFLAIVLTSAGYHTYRAAVANPVDSLRME